jgi:hypothetical protein
VAESDRGIHPDLLEETAQEAPPEEKQVARGRRGRAAASSPPAPTPADAEGGVESPTPPPEALPESSEPSEPPDWRQATEPLEAFKLLAKQLPSEALQRDETLSGLIGSRADIRAREIIRQQQREAVEQQKREAAANNDLYTLGELAQREYQQQQQAAHGAEVSQPFMEGVSRFQQTLPEAVQKEVAGKTFGEGKGYAEGVQEYLSYLTASAIKLGVERELQARESALRKSVLSEVNGNEPVPERENGTPSRVRVVTDEQVAAMSLAEYDALFDENGHPKPGVQHRSTRGIPLNRH